MVQPAGAIQTGDETLSVRVSGSFQSEQDLLATNFNVGGRLVRLGDIATSGAVSPIRPSRCSG